MALLALALVAPQGVAANGPTATRTAPRAATTPAPSTTDFPPGDSRFHTYAEMTAEVAAVAAAHPGIVRRFSLGTSYQGRQLWAVKVSDRVSIDENEPEAVFDGLHHGDEHMSAEMTLAILHWLVDGYGRDARITRIVNHREIWIVFMVNPDGGVYDISGGRYQRWRKNRQPNAGSRHVGTDLNRNYDYRWGCCGGSSSDPSSSRFGGARPVSAPESRAFSRFVDSRVIGGRQQIRTAISFHTDGRLVMWPYGYTYSNVPPDMTREDHAVFTTLGKRMAASNGYRPIQASDLYISSGTSRDWAYGRHRIFAFTFEMTVEEYAPDETIASETGRNRAAILYLLEQSDCPYRVIDRVSWNCGPLFDDLEINRGWRVNPYRTDTATTGAWQVADPEPTSSSGVKQPGSTTSGRWALVTGARAGTSVGSNDVDGGVTSIRSAPVTLRGGTRFRLSFRYSLGHAANSSRADYLRVRVLGPSGGRTVFAVPGAATDRDAAWRSATVDLSAYAGQTIRLFIQAADEGAPSILEAAVDDVRIIR